MCNYWHVDASCQVFQIHDIHFDSSVYTFAFMCNLATYTVTHYVKYSV